MSRKSKYLSTSTIISEVISMIETATKSSSTQVLNNQENAINTSTETLTRCKDESPLSSSTLKLNNAVETSSGTTLASVKSSHDQLLSAASILVYNKPEVRYAYPLKLQRIDCDTSMKNILKMENQKFVNSRSSSITKIYSDSIATFSEEKTQESSPESIVSSPSTLGSGKESKDRRNREKLLQGPGSEFSLTNPDGELELDYYDYNVANASAVPGSYLGMDPAFLVWIPPIDDIELNTEDLLMGTKRNSILALETEGAALTPSEYRRMKLSSFDDFEFELEQRDVISETAKAKTYEKLLPVDKLLEDSSLKLSMESVTNIREHKQYCVIPNRRVCISKDEELSEGSNTCKSFLGSLGNMSDKDKNNSEKLSSNSNKIIREGYSKQNSNHNHHKIEKNQDEDVINMSCKYKELMVCAQSFTNIKDVVNIPMTDLSGSPLKSIAQIRKLNSKETDASLNIQNSDYGIEAFCTKQGSFYDQNIKFVDEEDDEYIS